MPTYEHADFLVIGSGIAGLATAFKATRHGRVALLTKGRLLDSNTSYAQGGIAAALGRDDSPQEHLMDTLRAGHDLCAPEAAAVLVEDGPRRVLELIELGARFDETPEGELALGREAAHSKNRILHARGDATGAEVAEVLARQVLAAERIAVFEHHFALDLLVQGGRCAGCAALGPGGELRLFAARAVILATGGCGRVYKHTTNPAVATGDGFAMAARRGVRLVDMEFVQFHPTALAARDDPMVLISEAVRGEGARLVNDLGVPFMKALHPDGDLAPRDVVARGIFGQMAEGRQVFLDARPIGDRFADRFPTITKACLERGLDPAKELLPIAPAAHFIMGGVRTDTEGRTSLPGLYACGEVACTGVHGANRLASNSLLEGLVFAERVARALSAELAHPVPELEPGAAGELPILALLEKGGRGAGRDEARRLVAQLRQVMWDRAGIVRSGDGLREALEALDGIESQAPAELSVEAVTLHNMIATSRLIARSALAREESRGGHYREDFPSESEAWRGRRIEV